MPAKLNANDLTPAQLKSLGLRKPRETKFTAEHVRAWTLRVLAQMSTLTQDQRRRVLDHAQRVNKL
jgi:hypothetical protein